MKVKKMMKRLSAIMLAMAMVITASTVKAAGNEITTQNGIADFGEGTTTITLSAMNDELVGKKFRVHRLFHASVSEAGESINYTFAPEYEAAIKDAVSEVSGIARATLTEYQVIDYIQTLNSFPSENAYYGQDEEGSYSDYRYLVEALRNAISDAGIQGTIVNVVDTVDGYEVLLDNLEMGYYIVDEITEVEGTHASAALCMANTSTDSFINLKSDYPTVTKRIKEDDGSIGWNDIGDYEIGQTVPFLFESYVPNINGYHSYYYAWHDVMDEALTFHPESVVITISKKIDRSASDVKTYTLTASEFEVKTNLSNGETFVIEIDDIKAIIDREFPNFNDLNENKYYHTVILEYNATLNDKAAENTGRPGFENDVRLEFSNDPDSDGVGKTGYTPWDTTVCFTYQLDVTKTNNLNDALEGAKFRLYSDENCTNEVYVKQSTNGYNVINRDSVGGNDHTGGTTPADAVEMISKADGTLYIYGLDSGTYYLKETEAPAGYRKILDPIVLAVTATFPENRYSYVKGTGAGTEVLQDLTATVDITTFVAGAYKEENLNLTTNVANGTINLTVVNVLGAKLPSTGSVMTIVCFGLGTALVGYSVVRRRKDRKCKS